MNGYTGTTDAWLERLDSGDNNHGGSQRTRISYDDIWRDTTVLRFDLTGQIPANQQITSAAFQMYYISEGSMQSDNTLTPKPCRLLSGKS